MSWIYSPLLLAAESALVHYSIWAEHGIFALSGQDTLGLGGVQGVSDTGAFVLSGQDVDLTRQYLVDHAAYVLTASDVTLNWDMLTLIWVAESALANDWTPQEELEDIA